MKIKNLNNKHCYIVFIILSTLPVFLIFSKDVWFDETYTLALIQHDYKEIIEILKLDMHPPLYFISLKLFCDIFGYSLIITKIFSVLGYIATLSIGCTIIRKKFSIETSIIYMATVSGIPMLLYFSTQQRSYSWSIFFVTLCFTEALLFLKDKKNSNCILFFISALCASYNHIYSLVTIGIIFIFINIYIMIKSRDLLMKIVLVDAFMVIGYSFWLLNLLKQTSDAYNEFWQQSVEAHSVYTFIFGVAFCLVVLINKSNRKMPVIFAITVVLGLQVIGLFITIFIRPLYIARYSVIVSGIFAILSAFFIININKKLKKLICIGLCGLNIFSFFYIMSLEYAASMQNFLKKFDEKVSVTDTFIYCDSSFGIMSYYYPDNKHICTYNQAWFIAFNNLEYISQQDDIENKFNYNDTVWLVKENVYEMPEIIVKNFEYEIIDTFMCDYLSYELYSLKVK